MNTLFHALLCSLLLSLTTCPSPQEDDLSSEKNDVRNGADRTECYFPLLKNKRFAVVANQTAVIQGKSLIDSLCAANLSPCFLFAPEHGFRGQAQAGAGIENGIDVMTGLPVYSLYGKNKKPAAEQMKSLDAIVFDIQDVGCRFYTYLSSLHYVMEACAESDTELILLDRPNPNDCIDGPVLKKAFRSFVGMHPIPILHGCTMGEMAQMINGEKWLKDSLQCKLRVVPIEGWKHGDDYSLSIKPSPNLPNDHAIRLYPSLCLFEGTIISVGRGTASPFEIIGCPDARFGDFSFTPKAVKGFDNSPMYKDQCCYGLDLRSVDCSKGFHLSYLIEMLRRSDMDEKFFLKNSFFDLLAGNDILRKQLLESLDESQIRDSWQAELEIYRNIRMKYLLY